MRVLRQLDHISLLSVIVVGLVEALVFVPFGARNPSVLQQKPARTIGNPAGRRSSSSMGILPGWGGNLLWSG